MAPNRAYPLFSIITIDTEAYAAFLEKPEYSDALGDLLQHTLEGNGFLFNSRYVIPQKIEEVRRTVLNGVYEDNSDLVTILVSRGFPFQGAVLKSLSSLYDTPLTAFSTTLSALALQKLGVRESLVQASAGAIDNSLVICIPQDEPLLKLALDEIILPHTTEILADLAERGT
ncbi:MAG: hypothetical protein ACE5KH_00880 [Candidatus Geothermarchaeales archaeon]